jgi:DNA-directed RNA polymerase subunit RPC12/RpoP
VQVVFDCPKCLKPNAVEAGEATAAVACRHCGWSRPVVEGQVTTDSPRTCLVCGCADLWRQKDFPQQLGVAIVGLGILASTIAVYLMRPMVALGILMAFALVDMLLYAVMRDALACYRCHARYRSVGATEEHPRFNLELNERYRQEAARLQASQQSKVAT